MIKETITILNVVGILFLNTVGLSMDKSNANRISIDDVKAIESVEERKEYAENHGISLDEKYYEGEIVDFKIVADTSSNQFDVDTIYADETKSSTNLAESAVHEKYSTNGSLIFNLCTS